MDKGKSHSGTDEALGKTPIETKGETKPETKKAHSKSKHKTSQKAKDTKIAAGKKEDTDPLSSQQAEIAQLKSELAQMKDTNLRLQAEIQNIQRRSVQEIHKSQINAMLTMAPLLLETIDNLEKALQFGPNIEAIEAIENTQNPPDNKSDSKKDNREETSSDNNASNDNANQNSAEAAKSVDSATELRDAPSIDPNINPNINNVSSDLNSVIEGVALTYKSFMAGLQKIGVEEINPLDQQFDPEYHEAFARIKIEGKKSGVVVAVMQKGYKMGDRLLRAAKVQVAE